MIAAVASDERYLWRLRRAADRLRRLVEQFEGGTRDVVELFALEGHIGALMYDANLANMQAATRRPENIDETEPMDAGGGAALRRAS